MDPDSPLRQNLENKAVHSVPPGSRGGSQAVLSDPVLHGVVTKHTLPLNLLKPLSDLTLNLVNSLLSTNKVNSVFFVVSEVHGSIRDTVTLFHGSSETEITRLCLLQLFISHLQPLHLQGYECDITQLFVPHKPFYYT